jgi:hypothetical protein
MNVSMYQFLFSIMCDKKYTFALDTILLTPHIENQHVR